MQTRRAGIALGSNLAPRGRNLSRAVEGLRNLHSGPSSTFLVSSVYETEPQSCPPGSPAFLNAAVEISTDLGPEELLEKLQVLEALGGRPNQRPKNAPRTIDLDLLYLDSETRATEVLTLPHPGLACRPFVLVPMAEIAPHFIPPGSTTTLESLAAKCDLAGVRPCANHQIQ